MQIILLVTLIFLQKAGGGHSISSTQGVNLSGKKYTLSLLIRL